MAFSVTLRWKKSLFKKSPKLDKVLENCGLNFGSYNDFYILDHEQTNDDTMILYNSERIGRGIFLDFKEIGKGEVTLACRIPTTPTEIKDFFNIIREFKSQCKNLEIYVEDEKQDEDKFFSSIDKVISVCLESLKKSCLKNKDLKFIQTLAHFPYTFLDEQRDLFANADDLKEYENLLHKLQNRDCYYAKPKFRQFSGNDEILACYVLTSNCESIFPIKGDIFLNRDEFEINDSYINFFLREEMKLIDGIYKYDEFIEYVLDKGIEYFDQDHIIVNMSDKEVLEMVDSFNKVKV